MEEWEGYGASCLRKEIRRGRGSGPWMCKIGVYAFVALLEGIPDKVREGLP